MRFASRNSTLMTVPDRIKFDREDPGHILRRIRQRTHVEQTNSCRSAGQCRRHPIARYRDFGDISRRSADLPSARPAPASRSSSVGSGVGSAACSFSTLVSRLSSSFLSFLGRLLLFLGLLLWLLLGLLFFRLFLDLLLFIAASACPESRPRTSSVASGGGAAAGFGFSFAAGRLGFLLRRFYLLRRLRLFGQLVGSLVDLRAAAVMSDKIAAFNAGLLDALARPRTDAARRTRRTGTAPIWNTIEAMRPRLSSGFEAECFRSGSS